MIKYLYLFCLLLYPTFCYAQTCSCEEELRFIVNYYEENLPGYHDNVTTENENTYSIFKQNLFNASKEYCENETNCFKVLLTYVEFFKDNHSGIQQLNKPQVNENNKEELDKFITSPEFKLTETLETPAELPANSINEIENTYLSEDSVYTVTIIKSPTNFRDYAGIITASKTPLWTNGQVKFELKKVNNNTYDMFLYLRNHSIKYYKNVKLNNGILNDKWFNVNLYKPKSYNQVTPKELLFKELNSETNYLYIPTFSGNQYNQLINFYQKHDDNIRSKPYLIIDVRNNGGGSDACVSPLLNYLYTKPFYSDTVGIYVTAENIRKSKDWLAQYKKDKTNYDKNIARQTEKEIQRMETAPYHSFVPRANGELIKLEKSLKTPAKIIIITNKNCASSCETLLFWAMESDKTIIAGENSGGYVGYGEISTVETPYFKFKLGCTMTRYSFQRKFESSGISPQIYFTNEKDWVEQALEVLNKK